MGGAPYPTGVALHWRWPPGLGAGGPQVDVGTHALLMQAPQRCSPGNHGHPSLGCLTVVSSGRHLHGSCGSQCHSLSVSPCLCLSLPLSLSVSLFFWGSCPHACPPPAVVGPPIHPLISAQGPHTPGWSWLRPLPFYTVLIPVSSSLDVAAPFPVPWPRFQSVSQAGGCPQAGAAAALKLPPCRWPHGPLGQLAGSGPPSGRPACDQPLITPRPVGPAVHSSPGSLCLSVIHHWGPRPWTQQAGLCVGNRHSPQEPHTMLPNDAPHTGTGSRDALKAAF